jgi:capsular polysaccharide biosynthesis protein
LDIPVVAACLALAGLKREDIIFFSRPVRLREVWVPEVAFQEASHIYSAYRAMWTAFLGSVDIPESDTTDQPLFVSRRYVNKGTGRYLGEEKIEDYLTRKGVRVLYPEQLSFAEQIRVFNKHKRIIGTSGSGTHNIMLSRTPKSIVYLTPPEVHRNHFLIDACFEADSIFLQACRTGHAMRALTLRARAKIGLANPVVAASMWRMRLLNHARIIEWFESSGYL